MDDKNFYEMFMKAQEMMKSGNVPKNVQDMMKDGNVTENEQNMMQNKSSSAGGQSDNLNSSNMNFDMNTMMNIQKMMSMLNSKSDDDLTNLLFALKPYLRNEKKEKIDEYVKLFRMGKMAELWSKMNK